MHRTSMIGRFVGLLPLMLLASAPLQPLAAQGVRGTVVSRDSVPIAGAVVALLDSTGAAPVSALTDEFGHFELRAPSRGTWRLRTEAVGFARVTSFAFTLATAEVQVRRVQLVDVTTGLTGIVVRDRLQCDVRPAEGTQVALLWDEARKSLAAAAISAERAPSLAFDNDEIEYDSTFLRARSASRVTTTGRAEQTFRSDTPRALRALGYVRRVDTASVYYAPDARVLLSDDFAATHCFSIIADDPSSVRRVGIAFSPVNQVPGSLDVVGTLWLDRTTFALDRVEFRYDPVLGADFPDSTFGGRVRFLRLPTGHLIVSHWVLRMPVFAPAADPRVARAGQTSQMLVRAERRETVVGIKVARGAVRAFDAPPEPLPTVSAPPRRSIGAPSCVGVPAAGGNTGALVGDVHDARDRGVGGARIRATWHQPIETGGRIVFREQWAESGADSFGRYALCALPRGVTLAIAARTLTAASPRTRLVLQAEANPPALEITLAALRRGEPAATTGSVHGRVVEREGRPVAGAELRIFPGSQRILTDSLGGFRIEGTLPGSREFFARRVGYAPVMVAVDVTAGDTAEVVLALASAAQLLAPVTVEARVTSLSLAGFELRREVRVGGGTFIGREEIRRREQGSIQTLLRSLGGARVEESAATGDIRVYGRGGTNPLDDDRCAMRMMVDATLLPDDSPLSALPPLMEIAGIEVYNAMGAIPAQFSYAQPKCGLLVIWTRDGREP